MSQACSTPSKASPLGLAKGSTHQQLVVLAEAPKVLQSASALSAHVPLHVYGVAVTRVHLATPNTPHSCTQQHVHKVYVFSHMRKRTWPCMCVKCEGVICVCVKCEQGTLMYGWQHFRRSLHAIHNSLSNDEPHHSFDIQTCGRGTRNYPNRSKPSASVLAQMGTEEAARL